MTAEGKFQLDMKLDKHMACNNDRALSFTLRKPVLDFLDAEPTLENKSLLLLDIVTQKTVRHF